MYLFHLKPRDVGVTVTVIKVVRLCAVQEVEGVQLTRQAEPISTIYCLIRSSPTAVLLLLLPYCPAASLCSTAHLVLFHS